MPTDQEQRPGERPIWFPAKRYGWGWGFPVVWQGWVVMGVWAVVLGSVGPFIMLRSTAGYIAFIIVMVAILLAICYAGVNGHAGGGAGNNIPFSKSGSTMSLGEEILDVNPTTFLRPIALADAPDLFAVVDANRAHLRRWLPWLDKNQSAADTEAFIASVIEKRQVGSGAVWVIVESQAICGVVGFNEIDSANRSAVIGYWLAKTHQGRGIMTASVARLVRHGFENLNLNRISINAAVENHRSRAIPQRLGFRDEGTERQAEWLYDHFVDHVIYGQLKSEWDARR